MEIKCSLNTFKKTDVTFIDSEKAYISSQWRLRPFRP